jgi:hypothetical protein
MTHTPTTTETAVGPPAPSTLDDVTIDALILSVASAEWCRVAILIARTMDAAKAQGLDLASSAVVARIYALAERKALATQGNIRRWRAGEVRLGS